MTSDKDMVQKLLCSTYVDDIITGSDSDEAEFDLYTQAKDMFRAGGFNLRKFVTNSPSLQHQINLHEGTPTPDSVQGHSDETYAKTTLGTQSVERTGDLKILGVSWNPGDDNLLFDVSNLPLRGISSVSLKDSMIRWGSWHQSLSDSRCSSRSCVSLSWSGTVPYLSI